MFRPKITCDSIIFPFQYRFIISMNMSASRCQTIPGLPTTPFNLGTFGAVTLTTFSLRK